MPLPRRTSLLLLLGAVAASATAVGWWLVVRSTLPPPPPAAGPGAAATAEPAGPADVAPCDAIAEVQQQAKCREVGYYLWLEGRARAARESGNPEDCRALPEADVRDPCLYSYAVQRQSAELCRQVSAVDLVESCLSELAAADGDLRGCARLVSGDLRSACFSQVLFSHRQEGVQHCDRYEAALRAECQERFWTDLAVANTAYRTCERVPTPEGVQRCLQLLPPDRDGDDLADYAEAASYGSSPDMKDTDGDGLDDYDEVKIYRTDPRKSDTDGDGYRDGDEVKGGYNPKGPGKLKR